MILVIAHIFYPEGWEKLLDGVSALKMYSFQAVINVSDCHPNRQLVIEAINEKVPNAIILMTPSKGRDIGGKLAAFHVARILNITAKYCVILHDKRSPHSPDGIKWRDDLFRILDDEIVKKVIQVFETSSEVGLVASRNFIKSEYLPSEDRFETILSPLLKSLTRKYSIDIKDYRFVAGSMMWMRYSALETFFDRFPPLRIRAELEQGNALDFKTPTIVHAWERILSWIVTGQKLTIEGI